MSIITPIKEATHQLDAAFNALEAEPHSAEKQHHYERLKARRDILMSEAQRKLHSQEQSLQAQNF